MDEEQNCISNKYSL